MIGRSAAFLAALERIQKIARYDATVLIEGETGTGKELAARAIHYQGARQNEAFIPVNCGAIPDLLLENEFFGHAKGAFTDARTESPGLLRLANRGTLFLDEIDSLSAKGQVLLLRFLQDQRFRPLGSREEVNANVRVIAASNRSLQELSESRAFREDLLFRINLLYVELPPLRVRTGDIELLANEFAASLGERYGRPLARIDPVTLNWMVRYPWPGNVRELENLIHRELLLSEDNLLAFGPPARRIGPWVRPSLRSEGPAIIESPPDKHEEPLTYAKAKSRALQAFHQSYLQSLMAVSRGNVSAAARDAGKDRRALGRLLKRYGVSAAPFRQ